MTATDPQSLSSEAINLSNSLKQLNVTDSNPGYNVLANSNDKITISPEQSAMTSPRNEVDPIYSKSANDPYRPNIEKTGLDTNGTSDIEKKNKLLSNSADSGTTNPIVKRVLN